MEERPNIDFTIDRQPRMLSLIVLVAGMFIGTLLGLGLSEILANWWGVNSSEAIQNLNENSTPTDRNFVRWSTILNQLGSFLIPALFFTLFFYKYQWARFLQITNFPKFSNLMLGAMLMIATLPLVQFTYWLNLNVPLPDWAVELEEMTAGLIENLLKVDQSYELWFNLFVVAVIPAVCEEFLFRGVIQKKLQQWFSKKNNSPENPILSQPEILDDTRDWNLSLIHI